MFWYRIGLFFSFVLDVYFLWSRWNRRKQPKGHVPAAHTYDEIRSVMKIFEWRKDSWKQGWDSIDTPMMVWERLKTKEKEGDCDEAAVLCLDLGREGFSKDGDFWIAIGLLTVPCVGGGHNVAIFYCAEKREYGYTGNWQKGRLFGGFYNVRMIAHNVATRMDHKLLGWALTSSDLKKRLEQKIL